MADLGDLKRELGTLTTQMVDIQENQVKNQDINERISDHLLYIRRMMGILIVSVIIGLFMN